MTIDTDSWHRSDGSTPDGSRVNNLDAAEQIDPDLSREYAAPELGRIKEVLSSIDHKALNDLETRMKEKMEDEKLDQETVHYLSDFLGALQMLQAEKSGRNLENMIDKEASNDRRLDRILSIGDFSENRFKFKASDEPIRHAVTFLRRQIGFIAYHDHREVFDVVSRFRESREKKELEQAEQADQETAQEIRDNLKK